MLPKIRPLSTLLALCFLGSCQNKPVPPDFKIHAAFNLGGDGYWSNWEITISSDGAVWDEDLARYQEYLRDAKDAKEISTLKNWITERKAQIPEKISPEQVQELYAIAEKIKFAGLPEKISSNTQAFHKDTLKIQLKADGVEHTTSVYGWDSSRRRKEARRFGRLWRKILELVPSPNSEQKPELYR